MIPPETRQKERAQLHSLARRHDIGCNNIGLYLTELQELIDKFQRDRIETGPQSGPVVAAMRRAGMRPMPSVWGAIEAQAKADGITPQAAYESAQAWLMNGYKAENVTGALEWAKLGTRSGRDPKPQAPVRYSPSDPADLYGGQP